MDHLTTRVILVRAPMIISLMVHLCTSSLMTGQMLKVLELMKMMRHVQTMTLS